MECILLLPRGVHWRSFHIRRLVYLFPSFLVVFRICFLILIRIYLLYLCCLIGPSHSVWWVAVRLAFFRRLNRIFAVTIRWSVDTPSKEEYASQFNALFFHFLFIRTIVYLSFSIVLRTCMSIVCPLFFGSLYWGMLIYFLSWNLLDVAHSYLTCCGDCICCFCFFPIWAFMSPPMTKHVVFQDATH